MKTFWLEKYECTGCGACQNSCVVKAINLVSDDLGFFYPVINDKCIDCNNCELVCESRLNNNNNNNNAPVPKTYAAWSLDNDIRFTSTSGGVFSELAQEIINQGGVVVGASYNSDNLVEHIIIEKNSDIAKIRQSKYIQSRINNVFQDIKTNLKKNYLVVFCGTPCQVAGLYAFLGENYYDNLITVDFICRGVNSPKAYASWLKEIELKQKSKVKKVWFKYKKYGWKQSPLCTRVDFENNTFKVFYQNDNLFMKGYLESNLYLRPSCGCCSFKGVPRKSNITLADFWGIEKKFDDDCGTSMLMINNDIGQKFFDQCKHRVMFHERAFNDTFANNACLYNSITINEKSEMFLKKLKNDNFSKLYKRVTKKSLLKSIINKINFFNINYKT